VKSSIPEGANFKENAMKIQLGSLGLVAAALVVGGLLAVPVAHAQKTLLADPPSGCTDRVTGGGYILDNGRPVGFANFGAGGGLLHGSLTGYLDYVDHNPAAALHHVTAQTVVAYCVGCVDRDCRRITYSPATVDGVPVDTVIVEVCDKGEPPVEDTFSICVPSLGYCRGGVLGGDNKPSGGNIQLHAADPGCGGTIPTCVTLVECPCFPQCP